MLSVSYTNRRLLHPIDSSDNHLLERLHRCIALITHHHQNESMFFKLPDGQRFKAKATKRGQHLYGVAVQLLIPGSDGRHSSCWILSSTHLTADAATAAGIKELKDRPHLNDCKLITAV